MGKDDAPPVEVTAGQIIVILLFIGAILYGTNPMSTANSWLSGIFYVLGAVPAFLASGALTAGASTGLFWILGLAMFALVAQQFFGLVKWQSLAWIAFLLFMIGLIV